MSPKKIRTCVLYVRISLSTEESVSIDRQIEAGTAYAAARGWKVVGTFCDEGVSATHNRPEERKGWQELLGSRQPYDAVVVWKVDRLARKVIDFLNANEAVKARGAAIVAVEDPIDMTTAQGEAFAIMLAVFGQMEAAAIRARIIAARDYLLRNGRHAGGRLPYGYRSVPNPNGAGFIVAQDAEVIDYVKEMVRRTLAGLSLYSTMQWLNEAGAPTPNTLLARRVAGESEPAQTNEEWGYNSVDKIVRHPMLAGMIPYNPGADPKDKQRGEGVVRDEDGLPLIDESLAVMPLSQWRTMQAKLAEPIRPQRQPYAMRRTHSGALSGLIWCGDSRHDEPVRMRRGSTASGAKRSPAYHCPSCHQSLTNAESLIVSQFLTECGDTLRMRMVEEVVEGGSVQLEEASIRLAELGRELVAATPERAVEIFAQMSKLKDLQEEAKAAPARVRLVPVGGDEQTFAQDWAAAATDEERRAIIGQALRQVVVRRGKKGGRSDANKIVRLAFEWRPGAQTQERPTDAELEAWANFDPHSEANRRRA